MQDTPKSSTEDTTGTAKPLKELALELLRKYWKRYLLWSILMSSTIWSCVTFLIVFVYSTSKSIPPIEVYSSLGTGLLFIIAVYVFWFVIILIYVNFPGYLRLMDPALKEGVPSKRWHELYVPAVLFFACTALSIWAYVYWIDQNWVYFLFVIPVVVLILQFRSASKKYGGLKNDKTQFLFLSNMASFGIMSGFYLPLVLNGIFDNSEVIRVAELIERALGTKWSELIALLIFVGLPILLLRAVSMIKSKLSASLISFVLGALLLFVFPGYDRFVENSLRSLKIGHIPVQLTLPLSFACGYKTLINDQTNCTIDGSEWHKTPPIHLIFSSDDTYFVELTDEKDRRWSENGDQYATPLVIKPGMVKGVSYRGDKIVIDKQVDKKDQKK